MSTRENAVAQAERLLRAAENATSNDYANRLINVANGWSTVAFAEVAHHDAISRARG